MSEKRAKKLRKQYRKDVGGFLENGGLYELMELIIKPKPKYVPLKLWMWLASFFINVQEDGDHAGDKNSDQNR